MSQIGDVESLVSFPGSARNFRHNMLTPQQMQEAMRDTKPASKHVMTPDHFVRSVQQVLDIKSQDKKGKQIIRQHILCINSILLKYTINDVPM